MCSTTTNNNNSTTQQKTCTDCGQDIGWNIWTFWKKGVYPCDNQQQGCCNALLCESCSNKHPLFVLPVPDDDDGSNSRSNNNNNDLEHATLQKLCKSCFEQQSSIDFSTTYDVIPGVGGSSSNVTFVFLHGGGASRQLFKAHATLLRERYGHGSILLDLPGHASLVGTPLSLQSCAQSLQHVLQQETGHAGVLNNNRQQKQPNDNQQQHKLIYVGGSMGAYIGFYLLDEFHDTFDGAILIDCGQNVGPDASYKAKAGLVFLSWMASTLSNAQLFGMMKDVSVKSGVDFGVMETIFGAGMFFEQGREQVNCLRSVAPAEYIPNLKFPILFMNGEKDYRDCEDRWLELCVNKKSELKDYPGDHFFTHHSTYVDDIVKSWNDFAENL